MALAYKPYLGCLRNNAYPSELARRRDDFVYPLDGALDPFETDWIALLESKARRREPGKPQVVAAPPMLHIRTRSSHTDEVVALAVSAARIMGLNVELARAGATGHDIGHTPLGHSGERLIAKLTNRPFSHSTFGAVIAQHIERKGEGLHLTHQTLACIAHHDDDPASYPPNSPFELDLIWWADKTAFIAADPNDIERIGFGDTRTMREMARALGSNQREIVDNCRLALIKESAEHGTVSFSTSQTAQDFHAFKDWLYENIYHQIDWSEQERIMRMAYDYIGEAPFFHGCNPAILLALMSDPELYRLGELLDKGENPCEDFLAQTDAGEIAPYIRGREIDFIDPDLDW